MKKKLEYGKYRQHKTLKKDKNYYYILKKIFILNDNIRKEYSTNKELLNLLTNLNKTIFEDERGASLTRMEHNNLLYAT
jgi:hypothetical protein